MRVRTQDSHESEPKRDDCNRGSSRTLLNSRQRRGHNMASHTTNGASILAHDTCGQRHSNSHYKGNRQGPNCAHMQHMWEPLHTVKHCSAGQSSSLPSARQHTFATPHVITNMPFTGHNVGRCYLPSRVLSRSAQGRGGKAWHGWKAPGEAPAVLCCEGCMVWSWCPLTWEAGR